MTKTILDRKGLATALGISVENLRRLTESGVLPHHRFGGLYRYDLDEVLLATRVQKTEAYLGRLLSELTDPVSLFDDLEFKEAHAEGACAALRDFGLITPEEDVRWRKTFKDALTSQIEVRGYKNVDN